MLQVVGYFQVSYTTAFYELLLTWTLTHWSDIGMRLAKQVQGLPLTIAIGGPYELSLLDRYVLPRSLPLKGRKDVFALAYRDYVVIPFAEVRGGDILFYV